jgi:dUTP pyrophosphatase
MAERIRGFERVSFQQLKKDFRFEESSFTPEKYKRFCEKLIIPRRGSKLSAGYDICTPNAFELKPGEEVLFPTGLKAYMLPDENLSIHPRSGSGFNFYIRLANTTGIIDSDYYNNPKNEGHMWVKIRNESKDALFSAKPGDAVCQGIFRKYLLADGDSFETGDDRNGGIGSTNK